MCRECVLSVCSSCVSFLLCSETNSEFNFKFIVHLHLSPITTPDHMYQCLDAGPSMK